MQNTPWRIIGIDNGTSALGLCVLDYHFEQDLAKVMDLSTIVPKDMAYTAYPLERARRGDNAARRLWIRDHVRDYLEEFEPDVVAIETPFIGGRATLNNYAPLTLSLEGLIDTVYDYADDYDRHIEVERVSPFEAKRSVTPVGVKFNADKMVVLPNIKKIKNIDLNNFRLEDYSLDAVDGVAIAYTVVTRLARFD